MLLASTKLTWYVARSAGLVAWMLVAASIIWGLLLSGRVVRRRGLPAWLLDLHRFLGTLSLMFTAIHMAGLYFDKYVNFGWANLLVPYSTKWKPGSVAWGIAAFYLLIAIQLTSWAMKWLPRKVWHTIHLSSCLLFVFGTIHVFTAGTDRNNHLIQWITAMTVGVVVVLLVVRLLTRKQPALASEASAGIDAAHEPARSTANASGPGARPVAVASVFKPPAVVEPLLMVAETQHVAAVRELERVREIVRVHDSVPPPFRFLDEPSPASTSPLRGGYQLSESPFDAPRIGDRIA
jgi:methionine sulfoxide reductase heme-binding subunit